MDAGFIGLSAAPFRKASPSSAVSSPLLSRILATESGKNREPSRELRLLGFRSDRGVAFALSNSLSISIVSGTSGLSSRSPSLSD